MELNALGVASGSILLEIQLVQLKDLSFYP